MPRLQASPGWVGLGVSTDGTMNSGGAGSDVVLCSESSGGGLEVKRYWVTAKAKPTNGAAVAGATCTSACRAGARTRAHPLRSRTEACILAELSEGSLLSILAEQTRPPHPPRLLSSWRRYKFKEKHI